ncbi:hypothetical protein KDX04_33435 [Burkholderia cenocepacia]|uniref:hypothetical protein n=1 Tax=Burkholderia cenocepacia TaxID=95486 RepID=UPI001B9AFD39|nr:hypothetical protein [Burkholderia cenocepacia]MBR7990746.1 hypothetical protein [Burkholderia cenocepacia]
MERYKNLNGNSNVVTFQVEPDSIRVQFKGGAIYLYTTKSAGPHIIAQMAKLAKDGHGLNGFINRFARLLYEEKYYAQQ